MKMISKIKDSFRKLSGMINESIEKLKKKIISHPMSILVTGDGISYFIIDGGYNSRRGLWTFKAFVMPRIYHNRSSLSDVIERKIGKNHYWSAFIRDILEYSIPMDDIEIPNNEVLALLELDLDNNDKDVLNQIMLTQFKNLFDRKIGESMSNIGSAVTAEDADKINPNTLMTYSINILNWSFIYKKNLEEVLLETYSNPAFMGI